MLRYAITDRALFGGDTEAMLFRILALAPQLDYLQIRERDLSPADLEPLSRHILVALQPLPEKPRVLINHRADVALACSAGGVHLRASEGELTPTQIRDLYSKVGASSPTVSISCHTLEEVRRASAADLILFGPVFEKPLPSQPSLPGCGLDLLAHACRIAGKTPVLALGGITHQNQQQCLAAGAAGIAAIRHFFLANSSF